MARARNVKPALFHNVELAELTPLERLAFIGMWTIADFKGCIVYRPKKIKGLILPYDDCDMDLIAINLDKARFIRFYSVQGIRFLKIVNFEKHQNPFRWLQAIFISNATLPVRVIDRVWQAHHTHALMQVY